MIFICYINFILIPKLVDLTICGSIPEKPSNNNIRCILTAMLLLLKLSIKVTLENTACNLLTSY